MSPPTSRLPAALVADANVLLSATIGGRAGAVLAHPAAPRVFAAAEMGDEILEHLPGIARKRRLDLGALLPVLAALPLEWLDAHSYGRNEEEARRRMRGRDEEDWPAVAAALYLTARNVDAAIWTQDRDFVVSGLPTLTTGEILDQLVRLEGA